MVLFLRWPGQMKRGNGKLKGYVPLSFHGKLTLVFFQVKLVSELRASKGSSISSHFKVKFGQILYFLSDLSFGIVLQVF